MTDYKSIAGFFYIRIFLYWTRQIDLFCRSWSLQSGLKAKFLKHQKSLRHFVATLIGKHFGYILQNSVKCTLSINLVLARESTQKQNPRFRLLKKTVLNGSTCRCPVGQHKDKYVKISKLVTPTQRGCQRSHTADQWKPSSKLQHGALIEIAHRNLPAKTILHIDLQ